MGGCSQTREKDNTTLFRWPADENLASKWRSFVRLTRDKFFPSKWSVICRDHFQEDDFENMQAWKLGECKLKLKAGAYPSIRNKRHAGEFFYNIYFIFLILFFINVHVIGVKWFYKYIGVHIK